MSTAERLRTRSFSWDDPSAMAATAAQMPGLQYIQAIAGGALPRPPVASMLDFEIVAAELGVVTFEMQPAEWMYNPIGSVHGGIAATILDSCMGCAVHTVLDTGVGYTTSDLQVRYIGAISAETGPVQAQGRVIHHGRSTATAEGRLYVRDSGKLLAHATTACLILR